MGSSLGPFWVLFRRLSYYFGDLNKGPECSELPLLQYGTVIGAPTDTLVDAFKARPPNLENYPYYRALIVPLYRNMYGSF